MERKGKRGKSYSVRWYDKDKRLRTESAGPSMKTAEALRGRREVEMNAVLIQTVWPIVLSNLVQEHLKSNGHNGNGHEE